MSQEPRAKSQEPRAKSQEPRATHDINFWEGKFNKFTPYDVDANINRYEFLSPIINQVQDKKVLEIGCGNGDMSIFLAKHGAKVLAIDNTNNGINNALALAEFNGVKINAQVIDALDVDRLTEKFDFVVGKFILHHIEPFDSFAEKIKTCMNDNAIGLFYENSSRNKILIFFRNHLVGKFGVPKYGDSVEVPFEDSEIASLRKNFREVNISIPRFVFFSMLGSYIFRRSRRLQKFFSNLDNFCYKRVKVFNKYSYHQVVMFKK